MKNYYVFKNPKKNFARTGAKVIGGLAISVALVGFGFLGGTYVDQFVNSVHNSSNCESLLSEYTTDNICILPERVYIEQPYDLRYSNGSELALAIKKQGIQCLKIDGRYYTENSQEITIITLVQDETINKVTKQALDDQIMYLVPVGHIYDDNNAYLNEHTKEVIVLNNDAENIVKMFPKETIISTKTIYTESYHNMKYTHFILDVSDDFSKEEDPSKRPYEATLRLVPKKW